MSRAHDTNPVPAPLVALAAWLLPGSGYLLIGQRARALTISITILLLFVLGLLIGGVKVVDPPASYTPNPLKILFDKPWFVGQILAGPITLVTVAVGKDSDDRVASSSFHPSHARVNEIGTLYTAVAGMLNLLAIIDSTYRAGRSGGNP
ncbi:MAG: hypothetical protein NTU53_18615 [Planctomycetota bacterium]|nr:hypothetical protein [Planctomycetota bacterium]